jgi:hypothetical protein
MYDRLQKYAERLRLFNNLFLANNRNFLVCVCVCVCVCSHLTFSLSKLNITSYLYAQLACCFPVFILRFCRPGEPERAFAFHLWLSLTCLYLLPASESSDMSAIAQSVPVRGNDNEYLQQNLFNFTHI